MVGAGAPVSGLETPPAAITCIRHIGIIHLVAIHEGMGVQLILVLSAGKHGLPVFEAPCIMQCVKGLSTLQVELQPLIGEVHIARKLGPWHDLWWHFEIGIPRAAIRFHHSTLHLLGKKFSLLESFTVVAPSLFQLAVVGAVPIDAGHIEEFQNPWDLKDRRQRLDGQILFDGVHLGACHIGVHVDAERLSRGEAAGGIGVHVVVVHHVGNHPRLHHTHGVLSALFSLIDVPHGIKPPLPQHRTVLHHHAAELHGGHCTAGGSSLHRRCFWRFQEAAVARVAQGLNGRLNASFLDSQLTLQRMHGILTHVGSDACGLHQFLLPGLVDLAVLLDNARQKEVTAILLILEVLGVGLGRSVVQVLHVNSGVVVLRDVVGAWQTHRFTFPLHVFQHVEEALQHAIRRAQAPSEAGRPTVLKQAFHASVLHVGLHGRISSHFVVIQGQSPLIAQQVDHRAAPGRLQTQALKTVDGHLEGVPQVVLQGQLLQLFEG
mmetsp:Transcript_58712/g.128505  ORF Transcript_58712/g.128505 Transcript_58712/m.128505 type:complete len:490 (-) Transcript_58712:890-2359(-)